MIGIPREQYLTESTLPAVQELSLQNGIFRIADGSRFVLRGALEESSAVALASERIRQYWNCEGSISFLAESASLGAEEYFADITPERIELRADTPAALRHAFSTLRQLSESERGVLKSLSFQIPSLKVHDFPALPFRGIHLCWFPESSETDLEKWIRMAAYCKFNYAVLEPWGVFPYRSHPEYGWEEKKVPQETFRRLVNLGRELGIRLIPQVNLFGHAAMARSGTGKHAVLNRHPEFAPLFEPDGWTWCLANPATRKVLTDLCLEIHEAFDSPEFFHIGCDEAYNAGTCSLCALTDYPELFAGHLRYFHDLLGSCGARIMMWHDMLLDRQDSRWDGFICCGGKTLSNLYQTLPKDIVICDWQYRWARDPEGPERDNWITSEFFQNAGFDTLTCPWNLHEQILSVGRHAAGHGQFGMLQTVWNEDHDKTFLFFGPGSSAAWNPEGGSGKKATVLLECFNRYLRDVARDMKLTSYIDFGHHQYQVAPQTHQK